MEVDRQREFRTAFPQRIPSAVREIPEAACVGLAADRDSPQVELSRCPLGFIHRGINIPERNDSHREQVATRLLLDLCHRIVIDSHDEVGEVQVRSCKVAYPEGQEVRVQDLGPDSLLLHQVDPGGWVVRRLMCLFGTHCGTHRVFPQRFLCTVAPDAVCGTSRFGQDAIAVEHPDEFAVVALHDVRYMISKSRRSDATSKDRVPPIGVCPRR